MEISSDILSSLWFYVAFAFEWMLKSGIQFFSQVFFPFFIGAVGWYVVNIYGDPWIEVLKYRREIYENLMFWRNINLWIEPLPPSTVRRENPDWLREAESMRRMGARLRAQREVFTRPLIWMERWLKYDFDNAGANLFGMSHSNTEEERVRHENAVLTGLKLRRRDQP